MKNLIIKYFGPLSQEPDTHRKELVLNSMLAFCMFLLIVFELLIIKHEILAKSYIGFAYFLIAFVPILASYYFSRTRRINIASIIFIATFTIGSVYGILVWSVFLPATLLSLTLMTILMGILINSRAAFIYAICISVFMAICSILASKHIISHDVSWQNNSPSLSDAIEFGVFILFMSVVTWISNRQTELSLKRARNSEDELRVERDNLEIRVAERTNQIEQMQIEKISGLYKFIEFGKLSSGLIHDLINPLNALCIEIETSPKSADAAIKTSMNSLISTSQKIQNIIGSTRKHIQVNLKETEFSVKDTIEETLLIHRHRLMKNQIEVKTNLLSGPVLFNSSSLLTHILTNLISNAIDAVEDSKKNLAQTNNHNKYYPSIYISLVLQNKNAIITIKDNGLGIPIEIAQNIFNPFFTTKDGRGCGYGLSASKHIAEKYFKGTLRLIPRNHNIHHINHQVSNSRQNKQLANKYKTVFELSLPLNSQEAGQLK